MGDDNSGLTPNVLNALRASSVAAHTQHMTEAKSNISNAASILRHSSVRMVDEASPANARAVDKILRLPKQQ